MSLLSKTELREHIARLAAIERPSGSAGERRAAELIADELRAAGARVRIEEERVHGTYWWPIGITTGVAALFGFLGRRLLAAAAGLACAIAVVDDIKGAQRFRRSLLKRRHTVNVVAEVGPSDAKTTVLVVAHHDAAHSGLVFHPELPRAWARRFPKLLERANTTPGTMWGAVAGPALVALGSVTAASSLRLFGGTISAGYALAMVDIGCRRAVPGANDNLTGVAVLLSLACALREDPVAGARVVLVSTGSEESFMEGMRAFARRHFHSLPRDRTYVLCVDTVGSPNLLLLEGEGMLGIREYPKDFLDVVKRCARELDIYLVPNLRFRNATDGFIALQAGYRTAVLASVDEFKAPTNYHWPTDTPENVRYESVADAARLCDAVVRRLAESGSS
jgi:hypothetical protein